MLIKIQCLCNLALLCLQSVKQGRRAGGGLPTESTISAASVHPPELVHEERTVSVHDKQW